MIDNGQFAVRKPVLWFKAIGKTIPDGPVDLGESSTTVYRSTLARPGEHFYLVNGALVHEARDGSLSVGALTLRALTSENVRQAFVLTKNDELALKSILNTPARIPETPDERFPSTHSGVVRGDLSPSFSDLMDATQEFRDECDRDGAWMASCSDFGMDRTVAIYVLDIETHISVVQIEVDSNARTAKVSVADREFSPAVTEALQGAGIPLSKEGTVEGIVWDADSWSATQTALMQLFFYKKAAVPAVAMAV
jgi:hypothetical protein